MTLYQIKKVHELTEQGWTVVPPPDDGCSGGAITIKNPTGETFHIIGDGSLQPIPKASVAPVHRMCGCGFSHASQERCGPY